MESNTVSSLLPTGNEVLVVEDELRVRTMLSQALRTMGFTATLTPTAEAARKALKEGRFDIVILDLNLPGMDGMSFLKLIRSQQQVVEVIILTGFGDLDSAKTAIHLDVVDFITKPYTLGSLEQALDRARKRIKKRIMGDAPAAGLLDAPEATSGPAPQAFSDQSVPADLEEHERRQILHVLEKHDGNRANAAAELGISLRKLYYRIGQYQKRGLMSS